MKTRNVPENKGQKKVSMESLQSSSSLWCKDPKDLNSTVLTGLDKNALPRLCEIWGKVAFCLPTSGRRTQFVHP